MLLVCDVRTILACTVPDRGTCLTAARAEGIMISCERVSLSWAFAAGWTGLESLDDVKVWRVFVLLRFLQEERPRFAFTRAACNQCSRWPGLRAQVFAGRS